MKKTHDISDASKIIERTLAWVNSFWFVRGLLGCVLFVSLLETFVDIGRWEIIRALYAITVSWNRLAELIGGLIGEIPYLIVLPGEIVTLTSLATLSLPGLLGEEKILNDREYETGDRIETFVFYCAIFISYLIVSAFLVLLFGGNSYAFLIVCIVCFFMFIRGLQVKKPFRHGAQTAFGFVAGIQVLYLLGHPATAEWIKDQTCFTLEQSYSDCGDR
ncbi:hypothetical protein UM399_07510 [Sulfitobacter pontiacus]|uniref:hypothetical protein n=1 Tax=Sulfitobacter pontiacus TaxID=60137 RepID=UPI002AC8B358|nr:hypothetical protein [Sulfitobacter pontiacus]WPZ24046.1 hypothetical protein UM399_07510 [Sulfitobacter pontiacus]